MDPSKIDEKKLGNLEGLKGPLTDFIEGLKNDPTNPTASLQTFTKVISNALGVITIIGFLWFMFVLFVGAVGWISSGGDKTRVQNSQKQITNGLIGLTILISAVFFGKLASVFFGVDFLDVTSLVFGFWK